MFYSSKGPSINFLGSEKKKKNGSFPGVLPPGIQPKKFMLFPLRTWHISGSRKRGLSWRHWRFWRFWRFWRARYPPLLVLQNAAQWGNRGRVLTVLAVSAVMAVSVMTATPLKLNPPFPWSWIFANNLRRNIWCYFWRNICACLYIYTINIKSQRNVLTWWNYLIPKPKSNAIFDVTWFWNAFPNQILTYP